VANNPQIRNFASQTATYGLSAMRSGESPPSLGLSGSGEIQQMIAAPLAALALITAAAVSPLEQSGPSGMAMTMPQKRAALQPVLQTATECVARTVAADMKAKPNAELGDLIVDSMATCASPMRTMIETYDHYFGVGSGEAFFVGPYLELLPKAVDKMVQDLKHGVSQRDTQSR
jgi:hypothetical protein